jgi:Raf kinase inhibitor-like YbhB/YbcL family protein
MEAEGMNDFRTLGYRGPCPSYGTHHYIFRVFALDALLDLHGTIGESELKTAMKGHILGFGKLTGLYKRE